jgi:hypothetical protein
MGDIFEVLWVSSLRWARGGSGAARIGRGALAGMGAGAGLPIGRPGGPAGRPPSATTTFPSGGVRMA